MWAVCREAVQKPDLRAPQLVRLQRRLRFVYDSRFTLGMLVLLGVLRVIVFAVAYPPAHGADSGDYFLFAAQFKGLDAPSVFELIYPLYSLLIYLSYYVLGSIYWLIGLQLLMSALQGVVFYLGIRPYSPALGFVVALMVIGDAQTGILYNFTSTEPLYMFLLSLAFALFLIQIKRERRSWVGDVALGITLALVLLTRPVGRYLIVPFGVLFLLATRSGWRTAAVVGGFGGLLVIALIFNRIAFDRFEVNGGGTFMLSRPLDKSGLLEADNGPASARIVELRKICPAGKERNRCFLDQVGSWAALNKLNADAYQEMLQKHGPEFAERVVDEFTLFLRMPGLQYHGPIKPSDVQCTHVETIVDRETQDYLERDPLLYGTSDLTYDRLQPILYDIKMAMCPPWPDNDTVSRIVDRVAVRYRSISRPHPYVWYAELGLLVLAIPWARRRYLFPVLLAGAILANHAAISAVVLNVQPRYVAVTNFYKGFLLLALLYILGLVILRLADEWLARRTKTEYES